MIFNTSFLNKTANKDTRNSSPITTGQPKFIVWHGTDSPNPDDTPATLKWALLNDGKRGAANYYIPQSGDPYWYIDESRYIAWHAGAGGAHALGYQGFQVNVHSIGIELEERVSKKPKIAVSAGALENAAKLAVYLKQQWGIPLDRSFHVGHKEIVNPGYRYDPDSYSIDTILARARAIEGTPPLGVDPRFAQAWKLSGGVWLPNQMTPGYSTSFAFEWQGHTYQMFERGCARLDSPSQVSWLLISEVIDLKRSIGI